MEIAYIQLHDLQKAFGNQTDDHLQVNNQLTEDSNKQLVYASYFLEQIFCEYYSVHIAVWG